MKAIREATGRTLVWVQPKALKREYELRSGDDVIATLLCERSCTSLAVAESAEGAWTFKRVGFLKPHVAIGLPGSDAEVATFRPSWDGKGVLRFSDGRQFRWVYTNLWGSEWAFAAADGGRLLRYQSKPGLLKQSAQLEIESDAVSIPELSLLVLLGWYLMVLLSEDTAATIAATVAVTAAV